MVAWHFIKDAGLASRDLWQVGWCYEIRLAKEANAWRIVRLLTIEGVIVGISYAPWMHGT